MIAATAPTRPARATPVVAKRRIFEAEFDRTHYRLAPRPSEDVIFRRRLCLMIDRSYPATEVSRVVDLDHFARVLLRSQGELLAGLSVLRRERVLDFLIVIGDRGEYYVFVIPSGYELFVPAELRSVCLRARAHAQEGPIT